MIDVARACEDGRVSRALSLLVPRRGAAAAMAAAALAALGACGSSGGSDSSPSSSSAASTPAASVATTATGTSTAATSALVSTTPGPEGTPLELGEPLTAAPTIDGQPKDGVQCNTSEQLAYHVHAHLAIYVDGRPRAVPLAIGIQNAQTQQTEQGPFAGGGDCFYWLHTHTTDGIIHIESPNQVEYTLAQFFAVWGQPLSATKVGPASGTVTAYVNGKLVEGDPGAIRLAPHAKIQLDVGSPKVGPQAVTFADL